MRRRLILGTLALLLVLSAVTVVVVHSPWMQGLVWLKVSELVSDSLCLTLQAESFSYRLAPGTARATGVQLVSEDGGAVTVESLELGWRWIDLVRSTPRLERMLISGLNVDLDSLPMPCPKPDDNETPQSPFHILEINSFELSNSNAQARTASAGAKLQNVTVNAKLVGGLFEAQLDADRLTLSRSEREIEAGPLSATVRGSEEQLKLTAFELGGRSLHIRAGATVLLHPEMSVSSKFTASSEPALLLKWWDPELETMLETSGALHLDGDFAWKTNSKPKLSVRHDGNPFTIAGYRFSKLVTEIEDGRASLRTGDSSWGSADLTLDDNNRVRVAVALTDANLHPALNKFPEISKWPLPDTLLASGSLKGTGVATDLLGTLEADADLELWTPQAVVETTARWTDRRVEVSRLTARGLGATLDGAGWYTLEGQLEGDATLRLEDVPTFVHAAGDHVPELHRHRIAGGPIEVDAQVHGTVADPDLQLSSIWHRPSFDGFVLENLKADVSGRMASLTWAVTAEGAAQAWIEARGEADITARKVTGSWESIIPEIGASYIDFHPDPRISACGSLSGGGNFTADLDHWSADAGLSAVELEIAGFAVPYLEVSGTASTQGVEITELFASLLGGRVRLDGRVDLTDEKPRLNAHVEWSGIDPELGGFEIPPALRGALGGHVQLDGALVNVGGHGEIEWSPAANNSVFDRAIVHLALKEGIVKAASQAIETAAGPLTLRAEIPLGSWPRPKELWPNAPTGPLQLSVTGQRLALSPLLTSLDHSVPSVEAVTDLEFDLQWHPKVGGAPQAQLSLLDLALAATDRRFAATAPVRFAFDGREAVLSEVDLIGENSRFTFAGSFDTQTMVIDATSAGTLEPRLARLFPIPVTLEGPIDINARVKGPVDALGGTLSVNHAEGIIEVREPPLQITDLQLEAVIRRGVVDIREGRAGVNEGQIEIGGGWNPQVDQGVVVEIEDVTMLLPGGILTRWDGAVAFEPSTETPYLVVGDLELDQGLWDQHVDLGEMMIGSGSEDTGPTEISSDIGLDIAVAGRGGIHVDNNLGLLDVRWNILEISGTAASPRIIGDVKILPGGVLKVTGQPINLRRGLLQFTGDPVVDPVLEIIPEHDSSLSHDAAALATTGLSAGIGSVLGLKNTTFRPEDIAIETDQDTSTEFSIGQQLTHNTALFLTTDLRNSQSRTTLLQLWRLPFAPGLTIQGMTRTDTAEADLKLLQRFSWGGTAATSNRPRLRKVKLEGEWPASKRKLVKASGLVRQQPWDSFLLFLGTVRLERELTSLGYPEVQVDASIGGSDRLPIAQFTCDPGPRIEVEFLGDSVPKRVQKQATALYRFPPLEQGAMREMRQTVLRHFWAEGYAEASVQVSKNGESVVMVSVSRGEEQPVLGPLLEGVPESNRTEIEAVLGTPTRLAEISRNPDHAEPVVRRLLASAGYREVESVECWAESGEENTVVRLKVSPGPRALIGTITIDGDDPLEVTAPGSFGLKEGMALDRGLIDREISRLRKVYRSEGYSEIKVRSYTEALEPGLWELTLEIDPGSTAVVDRIDIAGRRHIGDYALRHGLTVEAGELFTLHDLDDSVARLASFGPVDRIDATTREENGKVVVDLGITEKDRWSVDVGGGWNSDRGLSARFGLQDSSLFGRGATATLLGRWEEDFLQGRLILGLPPLPGGRFNSSIIASYTEDVLAQENEYDPVINEHVKEATVEGTYMLKPGFFVRGYYRFTRTRTFEKEPVDPWFPIDVTTDIATLGSQIILDRLDNPFDPRRGFYTGLDLSWATPALGSQTENIRGLFTGSMAVEPHPAWTWFQSLRVGAVDPRNDVLDPSSRFNAGGPASIRGFRLDTVGPTEDIGGIRYVGGGALFVLNEELRIPVWSSLRGAVFIDAGQVWDTWSNADFNLSVGAGFGLRWGTPVGPVWADVAWPVANRGTNSGARFSIGIGRTF